MNVAELKQQVDVAPISTRAQLERMYLYATNGDNIAPELAKHLSDAENYRSFFKAIASDTSLKNTLIWAEAVKFGRHNWLGFFDPIICVQKQRMKTDGLPIQFDSGVILAPTGSRDNIANLYVFEDKGFNRQAAEYVTSLAGEFKIVDYSFHGIYGLYKYLGNVILEEWEKERDIEYRPEV
jgi:hypothetical protein